MTITQDGYRTMEPENQTGQNKQVVRRLVSEVLNGGQLEVIDELYAPRLAGPAKRWIAPFLASFAEVSMVVVELVAEDDKVVGRFTCSGTHTGTWLDHAPTGRRFVNVDEVYIFRFREGRIVQAWGIEDTFDRLRQLGLDKDVLRPGAIHDDRDANEGDDATNAVLRKQADKKLS